MKLQICFPQDGVEGVMHAYDKDGKRVSLSRIEYEPYFFQKAALANAAYLTLVNKHDVVCAKTVLACSGSRGRITLIDCSRVVEPACDGVRSLDELRTRDKVAPAGKDEEQEVEDVTE